ncbi:DUF3618 domain-containing protein [Microbacterium lacus]|uniref:DUF3618 domain-containing protein n=1 Tax=Microbacterium lacus TaxID=415217 RepID=UPI00384CD0BF
MTESTDVIRARIEETRRELGGDVDALADKVSPSKMVERQTDKVKDALGSVRDRVMGAADDAGSAVSGAGSSAADGIGDAKDRVVAKAQGNPIAVGLIAFGAGLLISSMFPASSREKDIAADVKDKAQPLLDEVTEVAKDVGTHLKDPAQQAATAVKDAAADSVETVKARSEDAVDEVKDQAHTSAEHVAGR